MPTRSSTRVVALLFLGLGAGLAACGKSDASADGKKTFGYVTNGIASFWVIAKAGALAAGEELDVDVEVRMPGPPEDAEQKRTIEELLAMNVDGIAISPVKPDNQLDVINEAAARTHLITHDSDAPGSDRLVYIGMDNYLAGRMCGELVKEALPDGGEIMIFVGRLGQDNADLRRQGLIDELLDRSMDSTRHDKPGEELKGDKYTILDTRTDNFDSAAAKSQAEDALAKYPDIDGMVGLFAYNPPAILEALAAAGKKGEVQVIAFDEDTVTLQAIEDGSCHGTVVQNPYRYGYESVKMLAAIAEGDKSVIPASGFLDIPARKITKDSVVDFRTELESLIAGTAEVK
ncbi:MAG: substrate-binding domain-containing protein [bacterium]|nr:substrate-binding domain-containing protein [bacterium]